MSSDVSDEKAIITIEVDLVSNITGDPVEKREKTGFFEEGHDDIQAVVDQAVKDAIDEVVEDALKDEGLDSDNLEKLKNLTTDVDNKGISNVKSLAKNPEAFMESTFMSALSKAGPQGALTAAIIGTIAGTPEMIKAVVEALGVKGGPLNQDYAFTEEEQMNLQLDRMVQFRRVTGDDPIITVQSKGFVVGDPDFVDNSLVDVDTARTGRILLQQRSLGYPGGV